MIIKGNILNVFTDEIYPGEIKVTNGIIESIREVDQYFPDIIVPGFIDCHTHIESSMVTPSRFAEVALRHGTTAVVNDPHEIANVMGLEGIEYMVNDAKYAPLKFFFTVPSCVPSTSNETNGAVIDTSIVESLIKRDEFVALSEVMDYDGVVNGEDDLIEKINLAKKYHKPIDGHAPLLSGVDLQKYVKYGISTEHECVSSAEALEKKRLGMKIMIREGSESHMLETLVNNPTDFIVTDDIKPEDLVKGHLNIRLRKAVDYGMDPFDAIRKVTLNPAMHYGLNCGCIAPGKSADFVFIDNLDDFRVKRVVVNGNTIFKKQKILYRAKPLSLDTHINLEHKVPEDFDVVAGNPDKKSAVVNVMNVIPNSIVTGRSTAKLTIDRGKIIPSVFEDVLKISVVERYGGNTVCNAFISGFGLKNGAIASSVSHDSHNIIVVGTNSEYMAEATNRIIDNEGGIVAISNQEELDLPLPIAGLMSDRPVLEVARKSEALNEMVARMGCSLESPFSILSFMALPVVPELKITNLGLFDVSKNRFIDVVNHED
ncbi:adenine deaminase [Methanosphaera sp. ISO3-F5]|uniref:adenine deaminase n=1 Tax=Methanosphaera sp. ISO3-F5 TaxID=1452353 RepID=UPI002B2573C4|nr:adenine deaminase [Methanosphaera sp. ISO3-F5]WQH64367.1 adenine deaminase [Methanosphaera sp. ISO3-F5]